MSDEGGRELFYQSHVFVCQNKRPDGHPRGCCEDQGATKLRNYMKARAKEMGFTPDQLRINTAGCLDRCELGPTMVIYPDGVWYHFRTTEDIEEILETHLKQGKRVERLRLAMDATEPPTAAAVGDAG